MATTTNFGWETPDDTDLVKDGAAAIRTALGGVDTSFVDLKGGTTGQVLSKASNTDLDYTWVTTDDANAIQNAIVDAKGDLIAASAADTPARLAVGSNYAFLQADSSTGTGLLWNNAAWTSFTPTVTSGIGTLTSANGNAVYTRIGKLCVFAFQANIVTNGTGSSNIQITLPFSAGSSSRTYVGSFRETEITGTTGVITVASGSSTGFISTYNNGYPGGTGHKIQGTISYEVA